MNKITFFLSFSLSFSTFFIFYHKMEQYELSVIMPQINKIFSNFKKFNCYALVNGKE